MTDGAPDVSPARLAIQLTVVVDLPPDAHREQHVQHVADQIRDQLQESAPTVQVDDHWRYPNHD